VPELLIALVTGVWEDVRASEEDDLGMTFADKILLGTGILLDEDSLENHI
jgi:hypothetical protein